MVRMVRSMFWRDPLLEKGWIFRGQDGQDTNKVREVMSSKLRSKNWNLWSRYSVLLFCFFVSWRTSWSWRYTVHKKVSDIWFFLGHRPICNQRVSIQQESCFSFWNLGWFQMHMPDWQYKRSNVQWPGTTHRRIGLIPLNGNERSTLRKSNIATEVSTSCIMYHVFLGGFIFLHPLVRFLDRPGVHELGKQHAVMAAWVASGDFETTRRWPLPPKLTRISGKMIFVDWIGWQFLDVFLSYFGGIQVGIWKNQDLATTVFFGMLEVSLVGFWRWHLSGPCETPRETQKAEGRLID